MKITLTSFVMLTCFTLSAFSQDDFIILRNGADLPANIIRVSDRCVVYKETNKKGAPELNIENSEVYMLHFAKRGNVYMTTDGKRITGETAPLPKDADVIYLIEGKELPAYDVRVSEDIVTYLPQKNKNKKIIPLVEALPRSSVFMIRYTDGTSDLITDLTPKTKEITETILVPTVEPQSESQEEEKKVIFHNVKKGETLFSISQHYDVDVNDLRDWNDLPASIQPKSRLRTDMQLMIFLPKTPNK